MAAIDDPAGEGPALVAMFAEFTQLLRQAGIPVGSGELLQFTAAMSALDPTDVVDLYWSGRSTLTTRAEQFPAFDRVFRAFFLGAPTEEDPVPLRRVRVAAERAATIEVPAAEPNDEPHDGEEAKLGLVASDIEVLRDRSFSSCTPDELAAVRRIMKQMRLVPPQRRTRRTAAAQNGTRPDMRRTIRHGLRAHGEPALLQWRRRRVRHRSLTLILDVSGSMADYSRNLVQFAHASRRANTRVEVFCFGTRLTRITRALDRRNPDDAMRRAASSVLDWEGGTRIGDSLHTFVRDYARQGMCRGGIVVICSDGLDRGDAATLSASMERLARLCHRIVWMNPHKGDDADYQPSTMGMLVAAPHIDELVSGHDLRSLERFVERLPSVG